MPLSRYDFTIIMTCFNREVLVREALKALKEIDYPNDQFELIIIDDGSSDNSLKAIEDELSTALFKFHVLSQSNSGKYYGLRRGYQLAKGDYVINCDSDDYLLPNSLRLLKESWDSQLGNQDIVGLLALSVKKCCDSDIIGTCFPEGIEYSDPVLLRFSYGVKGDKVVCLRNLAAKQVNFPDTRSKTKFIPESYMLYQLSALGKFACINERIKAVEYQEDGITADSRKYRIYNAYGPFITYLKYIELIPISKTFKGFARVSINYFRFYLHVRDREVVLKIGLHLMFSPLGVFMFLKDKIYVNRDR